MTAAVTSFFFRPLFGVGSSVGTDFLILDNMDLLIPIFSAIWQVVRPFLRSLRVSLRFWGLVGFMVMLAEKEEVNPSCMVARGAQVP